MEADAQRSVLSDDIVAGVDSAAAPIDSLLVHSPRDIQWAATVEVTLLIDRLEPTLDPHQRRLLHQIRLAAETLGSIRAMTSMRINSGH